MRRITQQSKRLKTRSMNRFYLRTLLALIALLSVQSGRVFAQGSTYTYNFTGSVMTYTVPLGITSCSVTAIGAKGGNANSSGNGGGGGRVTCVLATTPGQVLRITVGGAGNNFTGSGLIAGGYNGGGNGNQFGGGGGGASDIRLAGGTLADRVVVAAGGGGGGFNCGSQNGGNGGGLTGTDGVACGSPDGRGASQTAGGAGGTWSSPNGLAGAFGLGGNTASGAYGGGGGGGGWYGGGGGCAYGAGGGGSSYASPTLASSITNTANVNTTGSGSITITEICPVVVAGTVLGSNSLCIGDVASYSNPTGTLGGTWLSSNPSVATITNLGYVTGLNAGTATISYNINFGVCGVANASRVVSVNPLPATITGIRTVCAGSVTTLNCAPGGGTWVSSNTFVAVAGTSASSFIDVTGVSAGVSNITYTLPTGCRAFSSVTVNTTPIGISGNRSVCVGSVTTLSNAVPGGNWSIGITSQATVSSTGEVTGVSAGTPDITYTLPATGCNTISSLSVNALPAAFNVLGGVASYCAGGIGVPVGVDGSEPGVNYRMYNGSLPYGSPVAGTGSGFNFGDITAAGTYTVQATNPTTGCRADLVGSATVIVNPLPTVFTVLPGGSFCAGSAGLDVILSGSDPACFYQLYYNGSPVGGPIPGDASGAPLNFGTYSFPGTYTVEAINGTTFCSRMMSGSAVLTENPLPALHNVTGGGDYCPTASGMHVKLDIGDPGVSYQLFNGTTAIGTGVVGASSEIDFGLQLASVDPYTVEATNTTTGCTNTMTGAAMVSTYTPPSSYTLTGGGAFCTGGAGQPVGISFSDLNVTYQLYRGTTAVGIPQAGHGTAFDLGTFAVAGTYQIVGTDIITSCTSNMIGSVTITENALPTQFTMPTGGNYCTGGAGINITLPASQSGVDYELYYGTSMIGTTMSGTGSAIDFGTHAAAGNYTIEATNSVTGCSSMMLGTTVVGINPLPTVYAVNGGGAYCAGGPGVRIGVDFSGVGVSYQLMRGTLAVGSPIVGSLSSLDFGYQLTPGTYTVEATNISTGCQATMSGTKTITLNPVPNVYSVLATGSSYCHGDAGIGLSMSGSDAGINYQLYRGTSAVGTPVTGTGSAMPFGLFTDPGIYTVVAGDAGTGCETHMSLSATITINPLPTEYTVTGGGTLCDGGTGMNVMNSGSQAGVHYQLYNGTTPVGSPMAGTGAMLDFGPQSVSGNYTVIGTDVLTTCSKNMNGGAAVIVNPAPTAFTVTGGGTYCAGGAGFNIGLNNAAAGIRYQLYSGTTAVGAPRTGATGTAIDFGTYTMAGTYTVMATNIATGCSANMTGSASIVINPLPTVFTVFGGGTYCAGSAAPTVYMSGSALGANYQLYNGGTAVGGLVTATGSVLDFGPQVAGGTYNVVAIDAVTGCTSNMASAVNVVVNPLPNVYTVSGGGSYCATGAGVPVRMDNSDAGFDYQLYNGSATVGSAVPGAAIAIDFGMQRAAGTYRVLATNRVTGCSNTMTGSATVNVIPTVIPSVTISSGSSDTVCEGTVSTFSAIAVNGGSMPGYVWKVNGIPVGTSSSYSYVPASGDLVTVVMTSSDACVLPLTATGNRVITIRPYVSPVVTIAADPGTSVCNGTTVTVSPTALYGGATPSYSWVKNSVAVATGASYSFTPANGDVIVAFMTSNYPCRVRDEVNSNTLLMEVEDPIVPTVRIVGSAGTNLAPGQTDTLRAIVTNGGIAPTYQWYLNGGMLSGANTASLVRRSYDHGDSVSCVVTRTGACGSISNFNSVIITIRDITAVGNTGNIGTVAVVPNPNKGAFTVKGQLNAANEEIALELTNMMGQVVYRNTVTAVNGTLDTRVEVGNQVASGMYLLTVRSGAAQQVFHLVIEQ